MTKLSFAVAPKRRVTEETVGIDHDEIDRRRARGLEYDELETMKAGEKRYRSLQHPLDRYLKAETITARQYDAGIKLYADNYKAIHLPVPVLDGTPPPKGFTSRSIPDNKIAASRRVEAAYSAVTKPLALVLKRIVIDEWTLEATGVDMKMSRDQTKGALKVALESLADHYRLPLEPEQ